MIVLGDDYYFGMQFKGCDYFVIYSYIGQKQEFQIGNCVM